MISAILLTAGQSKRMCGENKLTKKIQGIPLIKHSVENILSSSIDELIVVVGYQKEIIEKLIDKNVKIKFVFNKNFESGMASSIKTGLNHLSDDTEAFFICLGDMPMVNKDVFNLLIKSKNNKEIIVPTYNGKQGNPVLFSKSMKKQIMTIEGDAGAKKILQLNKDKILYIKTNDQYIMKNYNSQNDFNL
jgi:molybdenum cofactor cytidylyltransferase|tara:strand:+ start:825 stop:1394 length:570 start_codon:yes stop_codon:yes gene_type:complete